jgi:hypothetical protein
MKQKNTAENFLKLFKSKIAITYPQAFIKDVQATGEALRPRENIQHFKR